MKKAVSVLLSIFMLFMFPGCDGSVNSGSIPADIPQTSRTEASADKNTSEPDSTPENTTEPTPDTKSDVTADSTLVVYFSCTGNTKAVAEKIAELTNADIYEITPSEPYTASDLNYNDDNCRANREMNDESCRPEIEGQAPDLSGYDTVFIGYPIWWGTAPRIINTFLDAYDLSGKTVMPFCTSGGSGVSTSVSVIRNAEPAADVRDGLRASGAGDSNIESWISDNNIR